MRAWLKVAIGYTNYIFHRCQAFNNSFNNKFDIVIYFVIKRIICVVAESEGS